MALSCGRGGLPQPANLCRMVVSEPQEILIDFARDSQTDLRSDPQRGRPDFRPGNIALSDRAEARDFTDFYAPAHRHNKQTLLPTPRRSPAASPVAFSPRCSTPWPGSLTKNFPSTQWQTFAAFS